MSISMEDQVRDEMSRVREQTRATLRRISRDQEGRERLLKTCLTVRALRVSRSGRPRLSRNHLFGQ